MDRNFSVRCPLPLQIDESEALGLLQHLDREELQNILDDETKLMEIIEDLQQVKNVKLDKETVMTSNNSLAEYNLAIEPRFLQSKAELAQVYEKAVETQKEHDKNRQKLDYVSDSQSLDTTLAVLQTETAKTEEKSDEIAEKWLDSEIELEEFLEQFIEKRIEVHLRRVKADKMTEILNNMRHGGGTTTTGVANNYSHQY